MTWAALRDTCPLLLLWLNCSPWTPGDPAWGRLGAGADRARAWGAGASGLGGLWLFCSFQARFFPVADCWRSRASCVGTERLSGMQTGWDGTHARRVSGRFPRVGPCL